MFKSYRVILILKAPSKGSIGLNTIVLSSLKIENIEAGPADIFTITSSFSKSIIIGSLYVVINPTLAV